MSETTRSHLIVVDSVAADSKKLYDLLAELAGQPGIDGYLARQRLIGRGPNLLAEGSHEELSACAEILTRRGWRCWLIAKEQRQAMPTRIRGLSIESETLIFHTADGKVFLQRGSAAVAVLADLSGSVVGKQLKHIMAQKIYNGIDQAKPIGDEELQIAILRAKPVLDLYLLDNNGKVHSALRVLPGRFDPRGLGERMSLSASINLQRILELVREYAAPCALSLDYGIANLPGCRVETAAAGGPWEENNLASLGRYGWIMAGLAAAGPFVLEPAQGPLGPTAELGDVGYVGELLDELRDEMPAAKKPAEAEPNPALPQPPPRPRRGIISRQQWLSICGSAACFGLFASLENASFAQAVLRYGIRPGLLPAVLAGTCLWGGFHFLRLKRRMENTPTSKIRSLAMGLVEVQGRAQRKYALVSPMSQLPCAYYRLRRYRRDRNNRWKLTSTKDSRHVCFYLQDETGQVLIDPQQATVQPRTRQQGFGGQQTLLMDKACHIDRDEKWVEETIAEGTRIYIIGQATDNHARRPPLRQRLTEALRDLKRDPEALSRYDHNGDGRIDEQEWNRARRQVEEQLLHQSLQEKGRSLPRQDRVIITRPRQRSLPFIIAETPSEAHLTRNYTFYSIPLFGGALLAVVWTVMMLVKYLHLI